MGCHFGFGSSTSTHEVLCFTWLNRTQANWKYYSRYFLILIPLQIQGGPESRGYRCEGG